MLREQVRLKVGDRVYIKENKRPFKVKACNERYVICTKPYNPKHTVTYFILDLNEFKYGPDDRVFCSGYETQEQCEERLRELVASEINISEKRCVYFNCITRRDSSFYLYWRFKNNS